MNLEGWYMSISLVLLRMSLSIFFPIQIPTVSRHWDKILTILFSWPGVRIYSWESSAYWLYLTPCQQMISLSSFMNMLNRRVNFLALWHPASQGLWIWSLFYHLHQLQLDTRRKTNTNAVPPGPNSHNWTRRIHIIKSKATKNSKTAKTVVPSIPHLY